MNDVETGETDTIVKYSIARLLIIVAVAAALAPVRLFAVKTEQWELKSAQDFMTGKLQRLVVTSDGELRLGYDATKLGEFAKEIWCSAVDRDGTIYFGTGSPADVYALGKDGRTTKLFEADTIAVTALALDSRGNLYAATMPDGKIYKISTTNKAAGTKPEEAWCRLRAPYIWSLIVDKKDQIFAGTGPDGKVFHISPDAKAEEWFTAEDSNILSLALDAKGALLAGGSDRGLLFRITEKGKGVVLHEFAEDEVKALAVSGDNVYVGVNKQKVRRPRGAAARRPSAAEFEDLTQRLTGQFGAAVTAETAGPGRETPPEARLANLLAGTVYVLHADGRTDRLANWNDESVFDLKVDGDGTVLAGMAGKGRVYRVRDSQNWELLFGFEEQQALTLAVRDGKLVFVGTGNVGNGYEINSQKARDGDFTSQVRDCRFLTTWGNLFWMGSGAISVSTRTGNTALPDSTWSDWSAALKESPEKVASPRARFIQVRAQLAATSEPMLKSLSLYYQMQNQKPEVLSIEIGEKPKPAEKPKVDVASEQKPGDNEGGTAVNVNVEVEPTPKAEEARPKAANPVKQIRWQARDKDGDTLVYRLYFQADGDDVWVPAFLDKPLHKTEYAWDTESIPDGWYRIKVVASDEESNPAGEALTDEKVSDLVKVDNTRPQVVEPAYDAASGVLKGVARDNLSLIRYLEYAVDGGDWKFFAPKDGVFDSKEEAFEVKIGPLAAGPHYIAVRATDEEGNVGVEKVSVKGK
ncbi:MAG TPA: WD40 repeat domain-containing protein [Verrucomicrobiae bacterium]|nr:WD40 repeat domain-containing protein [Verrucomicrobiae bacterium]